jgi:nucleotide-binding universal stress UspA family protein
MFQRELPQVIRNPGLVPHSELSSRLNVYCSDRTVRTAPVRVEAADQYGQPIDPVVRSAIGPDEAILAEARRRGSNLIVMGVARRPGENLFFGDTAASVTAASVLEKTLTSVLFLST